MLDKLDQEIIKLLQENIPLAEHPYMILANQLGITEEELLKRLNRYKEEGILRRVAVILNHREAGFKANGMVAWLVSKDKREEVAKILARYSATTHVYQRPTYPDWPYSLFSMVHGQSQAEVEEIVQELSELTGIDDYQILYSTEELKKTSMKYFIEEQ
jgi:DNA-binding Lrp family transcriptional regulator